VNGSRRKRQGGDVEKRNPGHRSIGVEIKIKKVGTQTIHGDPDASDVTHTYRVIDDGLEFAIAFRSHSHGCSLTIAGEEGILYTDKESNTVRRQVLAVGRGCGIGVESDELVAGLSPWSIRGVMLAEKRRETRELTLAARGSDESPAQPVVLIEGTITDLDRHL
jgi:hypothetical protein